MNTYYLAGYTTDTVYSPSWSINITRMGAAKSSDGRITATFSMMVPYPFVSADLTRVAFIHSIGPVTNNQIQVSHARTDDSSWQTLTVPQTLLMAWSLHAAFI